MSILRARYTIIALGALFLFCLTPSVYAFTGSGAGTSGDPYVITTCTQLAEMENARSSYYNLGNNIDCSGYGAFTPIGQGGVFSGTLDGQGYTISNLTITRTTTNTGLFRSTGGATIKNFTLSNAVISSTQYFVAAITGFDGGNTTISKVGVTSSTISSTYSGGVFMGGLVGAWWGSNKTLTISDSYVASTTISDASGSRVGGLIGDIDASGVMTTTINRSYFSGTITGSATVGGLVGFYYNGGANELLYINDSFSVATLTPSGANAGGIIGYLYNGNYYTLTNVWYDGKGGTTLKCGYSGYTISGCTAVNTDNSAPNYFKNSSSVAPMSSWDFSSVWATTAGYPVLIDAGVSAPAAATETSYYDPLRVKRLTSLAVQVMLSANPTTVMQGERASVGVTAAVTGRPLDWRELTLHLEYGRCDSGDWRPLRKGAGDIRFESEVSNDIFFTNDESNVLVGSEAAWIFPVEIAKEAQGTYCVRTTNDNGPHVDTSKTAQFTITTPAAPISVTVENMPKNPETTVLLSAEPEQKISKRRTLIPPERKISKKLKIGSKGSDVRVLQKFLNANGFKLDEAGPGSDGKETPHFGPLTKKALMEFQNEFGFVGGDGEMGPRTRAFINAIAKNP